MKKNSLSKTKSSFYSPLLTSPLTNPRKSINRAIFPKISCSANQKKSSLMKSSQSSFYWVNSKATKTTSHSFYKPKPSNFGILSKLRETSSTNQSPNTSFNQEVANDDEQQVKKLEKWRIDSIKKEEHKKLNFQMRLTNKSKKQKNRYNESPSPPQKMLNFIPSFNSEDSGRKLINMMGSIMQNPKISKNRFSKFSRNFRFQKNKSSYPTLTGRSPDNTDRVCSTSHEESLNQLKMIDSQIINDNNILLETIIKRKIKPFSLFKKSEEEIESQLKEVVTDVVSKFKVLQSNYRSQMSLDSQCKKIINSMILENRDSEQYSYMKLDGKQQKRARLDYFQKFNSLKSKLEFCHSKTQERKSELQQLEQKIEIFSHKKDRRIDVVYEMEELKAEIIQLPRKKSNLILGGMDSSGKEIKHIEKLLTKKKTRLTNLATRLTLKDEQIELDISSTEQDMQRCQLQISYLKHAKESYKIDLSPFFRSLLSGQLPLDYYQSSVLDHIIFIKRYSLKEHGLENWEGFDANDLDYISKMGKLLFQVEELKIMKKRKKIVIKTVSDKRNEPITTTQPQFFHVSPVFKRKNLLKHQKTIQLDQNQASYCILPSKQNDDFLGNLCEQQEQFQEEQGMKVKQGVIGGRNLSQKKEKNSNFFGENLGRLRSNDNQNDKNNLSLNHSMSHFELVRGLSLPKKKDLISKIYQKKQKFELNKGLKYKDYAKFISQSRNLSYNQITKSNSFSKKYIFSNQKNSKNKSPLSPKINNLKHKESPINELLSPKNRSRRKMPLIEIKDKISILEKNEITKLQKEYLYQVRNQPKFQKKMSMLYGIARSRDLLDGFRAAKQARPFAY